MQKLVDPSLSRLYALFGPVEWNCRIQKTADLQTGKTPQKSVLYLTLNNQMVRFQ